MFFLFFALLVSSSSASGIRSAKEMYEKKEYGLAANELAKLQAEKPFDFTVNYNLGNVLYRQGRYEEAKQNFKRALQAVGVSKDHLNMARFNYGNGFFKNCLSMLGPNWQSRQFERSHLNMTIEEIKGAIGQYEKFLEFKTGEEKGKKNLELAKKLHEELEKKKKEDKQGQNNQNNKNKDQGKQSQDKSKEQQSNRDKQKQDKEEERQNQINERDKETGGKEEKSDGKKGPQEKEHKEKLEEKGDSKQEGDLKENPSEEEQSVDGEGESIESKMLKATLEKLEEDESNLQKILMQNGVGNRGDNRSGNKNW